MNPRPLCTVACLLIAWPTLAPGGTSPSGHHAPTAAFPLKASPNRRYLVDQHGHPFFLLADTPWFLQKLPLPDVRRILDDRQAKGFNTLFLEILDDSHLPSRDAYGKAAFQPPLDITHPVEAYWRYADTVMEEATRRGFFIIMSDLWFGAGRGLWMHHVTPASARRYGRFLGRRYARFKNLMWMQCGDRNPDQRLAACTRELAHALREAAPQQLQTAHLAHEFASATFFAHDRWLDVDLAYTYAAAYLQVAREYERTNPVRPIILGETGYEGEPNAIELLPDAKPGNLWTPFRIRRQEYWAVLSGACGYCGGTRLWRFEANWRKVLNDKSSQQAPLILRLLESRPWWRLVPDTRHHLVTGGYGSWKQTDYVTAAGTEDGRLAIAYLPAGRPIDVALDRLRGPVTASWFDPTTGRSKQIDGSPYPNHGSRRFQPPGRNGAGAPDWVLLLESRD
jgi:Protein of unknown function (DUF4038)/Putative collagen-binding domain of a collagenase